MLCEAVEADTHFRVGPNGALYRYEEGVYRPDGEQVIRHRATGLLGQDFTPSRVGAAVEWFLARESVDPLSFDPPEGRVIYAANGILHLSRDPEHPVERVESYTHENAWLCQVPWRYVEGDRSVTCPDQLIETVEQMFGGDRDRLKYVFGLVAVGMIPSNVLRRAVLFHGAGRNGKSVFLRYIRKLYGEDNVAAVSLEQLTSNRFMAAELCGKLGNICGDIGAQVGDTAVFKQATGGDRIQAERKFGHPFAFETGALPFFSSNVYPRATDQTPAFLNRWTVVPFDVQFEESEETKVRLDALAGDEEAMTGLFNLSLMWAVGLLSHPSPTVDAVPQSMRAAKTEFLTSVNSVQGFLAEATERDPDRRASLSELFDAYRTYCTGAGLKPLGKPKFTEALDLESDLDVIRPQNRKHYTGIQLRPEWVGETSADPPSAKALYARSESESESAT